MAGPSRRARRQQGAEATAESDASQGPLNLIRHLLNNQKERAAWVTKQRLPVDFVFCALFLLGYFVVFNPFPPQQSVSQCPATTPNEPSGTSLLVSFLRGLWCCLHGIPVLVVLAKSLGLLQEITDYYVDNVRDLLFLCIRVLPLVTTLLNFYQPDAGVATWAAEDQYLNWLGRSLLWVGAYQVSWKTQIRVQFFSTLCLCWLYFPHTLLEVVELFAVWLAPVVAAGVLEYCVVHEFNSQPEEEGKGAPRGGTSGGDVDGTPETPLRKDRRQTPRRDALRVDIYPMLASSSRQTDTKHTYLDYTSMVSVETKYIKIRNDAPVTNEGLTRMAKSFAQKLTIRTQTALGSPCSVVKAVAVRGCLLFIAEVMVPKSDDPDSQAGTSYRKRSQGESEELLDCLPEDLQGNPMEIMFDDVKAICENGEVVSFTDHDGTLSGLEIPDVVLVRPPCVVEQSGSADSLEVFMSEVKGNWDSLKLVVVVKDSVANEVDVKLKNEDSFKVDVASTVGGTGGYLRMVGVEERLGTFVGGLAPFLMLPAKVAEELNRVFEDIVSWLEGDEGADVPQEQDDKTMMEKMAWEKHFKPFAMDMTYLLAPESDDLFEMMNSESDSQCQVEPEGKNDYLQVFLHVADFLEAASARETEDYLLTRLKNAGVTLHCGGKDVSAMSVFPESPPPQLSANKDDPSGAPEFVAESGCEKSKFSVLKGFVNPVMEGHYQFHFNRHQVLMDLAGMTMGLCLLPVISVVGENGRCLYLCPLVMHLRLSLLCWLMSRGTYISNREPIVMLSWGVRTVAWLGHSLNQQSLVGGQFAPWPALSFLVWTIFVRPHVLKVPFSMHMILGAVDAVVGTIGLVLSTWCEDWWVIIQGPAVLLAGLLGSIPVVYYTEKYDRERFRVAGPLAKG